MSISKYLDPKNDFAFKRVFGSDKHKDILIHFINDMLGFIGDKEIKEVVFLTTYQEPEVAALKQSIVDVKCTDQRGRQYIVEMQVAASKAFAKRAQYYAAKAYSSQLKAGEADYSGLKEIIFLAITDFKMFPDKPEYKSDHVILDKNSYAHDLKDFSFTFLELPKFNKDISELSNMVEKWTYFFKNAPNTSAEDLEKIVGQDTVIKEAFDVLEASNLSPEEFNSYEQAEKREMDARAILQAAEDQGVLKVAKNMFSQGLSIEEISKFTGLSMEEIESQKWKRI